MTSGIELEQTDWSTSQSKEGRGSSYKEGTRGEKMREKEEKRKKRERREIARTTTEL